MPTQRPPKTVAVSESGRKHSAIAYLDLPRTPPIIHQAADKSLDSHAAHKLPAANSGSEPAARPLRRRRQRRLEYHASPSALDRQWLYCSATISLEPQATAADPGRARAAGGRRENIDKANTAGG